MVKKFFKLITDLFLNLGDFFIVFTNILGNIFIKLINFSLRSKISSDNDNSSNNPDNHDENNDELVDNQSTDNSYFKKLYHGLTDYFVENDKKEEIIFKELSYRSNKDKDKNNNSSNDNEKYLDVLYSRVKDKVNPRLIILIAIVLLPIILIVSYLLFTIEIIIAIVVIVFLAIFAVFYLPKIQKEKRYSEISKELPYALRHMVIELRSGKGLQDSLSSIAIADYGALSEEISRAIEEIKYGESTEKSLVRMSKRVSSNVLDRTVQQIVGTLRTGGNLSNSLGIIAEDITHDIQMNLKEYSQKLNAFIMIYTFLVILAPVILLIMVMAASTVMGDIIPSNVILILYIFFFPMVIIFMGLMIKKLEPSV